MDTVDFGSKFTMGIVSKVLKTVVKAKTGYNADIQLNEFNARITDGKAHVHLSVDADMTQAELMKVLANVGLG